MKELSCGWKFFATGKTLDIHYRFGNLNILISTEKAKFADDVKLIECE